MGTRSCVQKRNRTLVRSMTHGHTCMYLFCALPLYDRSFRSSFSSPQVARAAPLNSSHRSCKTKFPFFSITSRQPSHFALPALAQTENVPGSRCAPADTQSIQFPERQTAHVPAIGNQNETPRHQRPSPSNPHGKNSDSFPQLSSYFLYTGSNTKKSSISR